MTTSVFPHLVPDRYQELMRVARQWRKLNLMRWNGFSHQDKQATPGDLALFCPACPQPGINVSLSTGDTAEGNDWLYSRSLVMDGNFKVEHLHSANPSDEEHLSLAKEAVQRSESNASRHRLEATGIGGCACARHGCFVPHAMVDFQKGGSTTSI
ncbi:hypothetical protein DFJ58DRAFT_719332 [Suillus subalutaceus]|uniref:uncharacterized protein n=1 Tax=Suillus subalutaceus TaxID=48586 RepID=UPI001B875051|nr:uncharacterized protein DFJ58DRAFT_719332 [Suillus subalutaceus]KAG1834664.1 hypothetical protein DFJ58DRAFT_719332 [Suillus subalutaceus]